MGHDFTCDAGQQHLQPLLTVLLAQYMDHKGTYLEPEVQKNESLGAGV